MKKLLTILGSVGLTATTASTIVACQIHNNNSIWHANNMLANYLIDKKVDADSEVDHWYFNDIQNFKYEDLFDNYDLFFKNNLFEKVGEFAKLKKENKGNLKIKVDMTDEEILNLPKNLEIWAKSALSLVYVFDNGATFILTKDNQDVKDKTFDEILKYMNESQKQKEGSLGIAFDKSISDGIGFSLDEIKDSTQQAPNIWVFEVKK